MLHTDREQQITSVAYVLKSLREKSSSTAALTNKTSRLQIRVLAKPVHEGVVVGHDLRALRAILPGEMLAAIHTA